MTYYGHVAKDKLLHTKYHTDFVQGLPWKDDEGGARKIKVKVDKSVVEVRVCAIDRGVPHMVKRVDKLLEMVNCELNAPPANTSWKQKIGEKENIISEKKTELGDGSAVIPGKAYVLVARGRAIGVVVTEPIVDVRAQARWMVDRTQEIVEGQINRNTKLGISRIWVAPKWRRFGLGKVLLQVVLDQSVYGMKLKAGEVAFSQPSHTGGLLARSFNGVRHKSGEVLVPVYLEN